MSVTINGKVIGNTASVISNVISNSCAVFGKDDKIKITADKIKNGCNYNNYNLGIDKLVLLLQGECEAEKNVIRKLLTLYGKKIDFKPVFNKPKYTVSANTKAKLIYTKKWQSKLTPRLFIEIDPVFPDVPYVRITMNPSKMGAAGIAIAKEQLNKVLPWGYSGLIKQAAVSYLEVCYDVPVEKKSLSLYCERVHSSPDYSPNKGDGTIYFGKKSSLISFKIYNRKKKMKRVEQETISEEYLTRLEAMVKKAKFSKLADVSSPFTRLHVFETSKLDIYTEVKDPTSFFTIMQEDGFYSAMKSLPHYRRKKALQHFAPAIPTWWTPEETWKKQWGLLLDQYGLLCTKDCAPSLMQAAS